MNVVSEGETLRISDIVELHAGNSAAFRTAARQALEAVHRVLDIDLAQTRFIDSGGLGALIALHKTMTTRGGRVRLLKPAPQVLQILELTRLHQVLEIVPG